MLDRLNNNIDAFPTVGTRPVIDDVPDHVYVCSVLIKLIQLLHESGQWLKGRIYERRCDLSPNGQFLVYFAGKYKRPLYTWTAISNAPYLNALALWEKGDGWGGGGLFKDERTLLLNHRPGTESQLLDGFNVPESFCVRPLGERPGWGEDEPINSMRLQRDGWVIAEPGKFSDYLSKGPYAFVVNPPQVIEKPAAGGLLKVSLHAIGERSGTSYVQNAQLDDVSNARSVDLGRVDWADVDHSGDVLFAKDGRLYRLRPPTIDIEATKPQLVADLNELSFVAREAPNSADRWPSDPRYR